MLSILRDFLRTLKMEIFGSGVLGENTSFDRPEVEGGDLKTGEVEVEGERLDVEIEELDVEGGVEILNGSLDGSAIEVERGELEAMNLEIRNGDFKTDVDTAGMGLGLESRVIEWDPGFEPLVIESIEGFSAEPIAFMDLDHIWDIRFEPSFEIERDKLLEAIERFLRKHRGSLKDVRFVGYFKNVPITNAEKMTVERRELVVRLKKGRGKVVKVDVVVFKTDRGFVMEVI